MADFTGKKAQHLNMAQDGIKIRSASFKNKKAYDRKVKHKNTRDW